MNPFRKPASPEPGNLDDETLIRAVADGSTPALAALYDRYGRLVFSLAMNITGDAAAAEEITQDVFIQVWNKGGTFRPEQGRLSTWLTSIARHRAIDALRRRGARAESRQVSWDDGHTPDLPDGFAIEDAFENGQRQREIRAAMAALPEDQQRALALAFFNGLTHQQVAETLHEPLGTIKTRIRLAMQKLRQALEEKNA